MKPTSRPARDTSVTGLEEEILAEEWHPVILKRSAMALVCALGYIPKLFAIPVDSLLNCRVLHPNDEYQSAGPRLQRLSRFSHHPSVRANLGEI